MTDLPGATRTVHGSLGATARMQDGDLVLDLTPSPAVLHHGIVRASVLSFLVDAVSGIPLDDDDSAWALTTDMTVRMDPRPAPGCIAATHRVLRRGRRSATGAVDLTTDTGELIGAGAVGFARIPRKDTDPPKPNVSPERILQIFQHAPSLEHPVREEAGIEVLDAANGIVQVELSPAIQNPAGTMQGAMVALLAESAAEELVAARTGADVVVTDIDLRYLSKTGVGPVRTTSRLVGDTVEVQLTDTSTDELTTLVYCRTTVVG